MLESFARELLIAAIVAIVGLILGWLYRRHLLGKIIGIQKIYGGTAQVFENAHQAFSDLEKEAMQSNNIRYLGSYSATLLREKAPYETFLYKLLAEKKMKRQSLPKVRFLILNPSSQFIEIRKNELQYPAYSQEFRNGIISSVATIKLIATMLELPEDMVEVRLYDFQLVFRLTLLDKYGYIAFYKPGRIGPNSPVLKVSQDSELYQSFSRLFNTYWEYESIPSSESEIFQ